MAVRVLVRCIYHKAVQPSCHIIEMEEEVWRRFLFADNSERKSMVLNILKRDRIRLAVREVVWVPLTGCLKDAPLEGIEVVTAKDASL